MSPEEYLQTLKVGDKVKLLKRTGNNKFSAGEEITVLGFLDNDSNKIIAEGCAPGGWIDATKLRRNIKRVRHMNLLEMLISSQHARADILSVFGKNKKYLSAFSTDVPGKTPEVPISNLDPENPLKYLGDTKRWATIFYLHNGGYAYFYLDYLLPYDSDPINLDGYELRVNTDKIEPKNVAIDGQFNAGKSEEIKKTVLNHLKDLRIQGNDIYRVLEGSLCGNTYRSYGNFTVDNQDHNFEAYIAYTNVSIYKDNHLLVEAYDRTLYIMIRPGKSQVLAKKEAKAKQKENLPF